MTIKAIDTRYGGCRFRSRLEARWAVFLNELGIAWEYEPQGFEVTDRLQLVTANTFRYLPDFWLPERNMWFEVKGELDASSRARLLTAAACLSSDDDGGCRGDAAKDVVVAGPLTANLATGVPVRLHMHKGDLHASCMFCKQHPFPHYVTIANDIGEDHGGDILRGYYCAEHCSDPEILAALDAARTARFEHKGGRR